MVRVNEFFQKTVYAINTIDMLKASHIEFKMVL